MRRALFRTIVVIYTASLVASAHAQAAPPSAPIELYRELRSVRLDASRTYGVRDAVLDLEDIHLSLNDGTISFTQAVDGHVTGAFFSGDAELLLIPPDRAERASLALFTKSAVLEEQFTTAYFRFDEDLPDELSASLRPADDAADFVNKWGALAQSFAESDALRLLLAYTNQAPGEPIRRVFHAHIGGGKLGSFDVLLDSGAPEQISVAQTGYTEAGDRYYDVWMSFAMRSVRARGQLEPAPEPLDISAYKIDSSVLPPHELEAEAELTLTSRVAGQRALLFELSRFLKISSVTIGDKPVEFIQNEAIPGSQLERRGNDIMAVLLPTPLTQGEPVNLKFSYAGSAMSLAGGGLMYVGARGAWYPNLGPEMATFDLQFRYPKDWTLLATGVRTSLSASENLQAARWISERPIPLAGFNLGQYAESDSETAQVNVATYAARGIEKALQQKTVQTQVVPPLTPRHPLQQSIFEEVPALSPSPAANVKKVEQRAVDTVNFISSRVAPFPYRNLSITQMPGPDSQGWPGLVFLSSFAFLSPQDRPHVAEPEYENLLYDELMPAHEIGHQWWGDAVLWRSYRDQWLMEALANYCALKQIEAQHPDEWRFLMDRFRQDLLRPLPKGGPYLEAGPVTLGLRLASSKFPNGYHVVAYERGSWLLHMLESMLDSPRKGSTANESSRFLEVLRGIQRDYAGRELSTQDFQRALEKALPPDLRYEGKPSLDWFFESWVNGTAIPRIEMKEVRIAMHRRELLATGTLLQEEAPKDLVTSVPLYAVNAAGKQDYAGRVFADGTESSFRLVVPAGTKKILLDPAQTILRR